MSRRHRVMLGLGLALTCLAGSTASARPFDPDDGSTFVPITACRLVDTRPAPDTVGSRASALGAADTLVTRVWGTNGNCTIPSAATAVSMNVTIIEPTAASYLTVWPSDVSPRPVVSSLNWVAGQGATPNAVTSRLSADGSLSFFNLTGSVHLIVDVVGYYQPISAATPGGPGPTGPAGPTGATGPTGPRGPAGARPAREVWVAPSGGDYTSLSAALAAIGTTLPAATAEQPYVVKIAPGNYTEPNSVALEDHVDVEGAGTYVTTITCACSNDGSSFLGSATLHVDGDISTNVSGLTIVNAAGAGTLSSGLWIAGATTHIGLHDLRVWANGTTSNAYGIGISNSVVDLRRVFVSVTGAGMRRGLLQHLSTVTFDDGEVVVGFGGGDRVGIEVTTARLVVSDTYVSGNLGISYIGDPATASPVIVSDTVILGGTSGVDAGDCSNVLDQNIGAVTCS